MKITRILFIAIFLISTWTYAASRGIDVVKSPIVGAGEGKYYALIIANADYRDSAGMWQPLKTTITGAKGLASLLKASYQFSDIRVLENSTRREIILAMSELNKIVKNGDNVLVYYAGHGFLDGNTDLGYWIPVDAQGNDHSTYIRNSTIRDELNVIAKRARHTLLISDSCFSGSLLQANTRGPENFPVDARYYDKLANKKSVQIITAGGIEFVDDDYNDTGLSPFTHFLINELKHNDAFRLSASELAHQIKKAVSSNVNQTPQAGVLQGAGDELGEFIFVNVTFAIDRKAVEDSQVNSEQSRDQKTTVSEQDENQSIRRRLPMPVF